MIWPRTIWYCPLSRVIRPKPAFIHNWRLVRKRKGVEMRANKRAARTKRQLWMYAGLGLITRDSGQYQIVRGQIIRRDRPACVPGLKPQHNRELKEIFKGAALTATRSSSPLHAFYQQRLDQGMPPHLARLTLARKIATLTWILWKKGERFNAHDLTSQAE